ncbi:MAG: monovalent cation:proton antiporter-2 (CPA2) family protein [Rickettsiales bacterium]|nr:monovalent cation:proton antiporter-2 (CPA2) family protein [Rickettsiales bacterium]
MDHILFSVFVFLAAACVVVPLASRIKLGAVLGYLMAGIAIGPFGLGLIHNPENIMHIAEFGVVMMLFVIGLELDPSALWRLRKSIIGLGGLQLVLTSVLLTLAGVALGYDWQLSMVVAMALSLSSTALVLQILEEKNLLNTPVGESAFAVLLFQDIAVIPILALLPLLADHTDQVAHAGSMMAGVPGWLRAILVAVVIAGMIVIGRQFSHHLFRAIAKTNLREVFTAMTLALVIGITILMQMLGVSPALGAFIAGVVLANSEYRHTLESDIEPFKGLLLGLFFISVGMGMDFGLLAQSPWTLLGVVVALMALKGLILFALGKIFGLMPTHNYGFAFALCQGGEFAFVLFQYALGLDLLSNEQTKFLTLAVALSIACTPLLMLIYSSYIMPKFMSLLYADNFDAIEEQHPVILAGFGRFGQIIGRFLMGQGVKVTVLEKDPDQVELIRKFGFKGYFGDASRLDLLHSAGAGKAKLLIVAVDDADSALKIVQLAKKAFPQIQIFARARNRRHAYELDKLGVDYFKRETFDSALDMAQQIMVQLGYNAAEMQSKAAQFKAHDETTLRKSFAFFDNEPEMINFTKTSREELTQILRNDTV